MAMVHSIEYWLGAFGGGALVGAASGLVALYIGALVNEMKAAKRVFFGFLFAGLLGGLKLIGILFVPLLCPIFEARRKTKHRLAQQAVQADSPVSGGPAA